MILSGQGRGRRLVAQVLSALLLTAALAGCGPADSGLKGEAARTLQESVLGVSQAAAGSDHAAAMKTLDILESDLAAAVARGQVSEDRRRTIMTAIAAVRADLASASAAAEAEAAAQAAAAKTAQEAAAAEQAKAEADAAATATQEAAVPPPAPADNAKGSDDKGGEKGKGKDD